MTLDELKSAAKEMGYNLVKIQEKVKKLNCSCGASSRTVRRWIWIGSIDNDTNGVYFRCSKCGLKSDVKKTIIDATKAWNELVSNK